MPAVIVRFRGIVQGVNFRRNLSSLGEKYGIKGWVKNLENGEVLAFIQGGNDTIEKLLNDSRKLPGAVVTGISLEWTDEEEIEGFTIRY